MSRASVAMSLGCAAILIGTCPEAFAQAPIRNGVRLESDMNIGDVQPVMDLRKG